MSCKPTITHRIDGKAEVTQRVDKKVLAVWRTCIQTDIEGRAFSLDFNLDFDS